METHRCTDYSKALFFGKSVANKLENSLRVCAAVWLFVVLLLCGAPASADLLELDQNCVVSILNRTIQGNADGSFDMPNVPANMGKVKATATCIRDGKTIGGETEYFTVVANQAVRVGDFFTSAGEVIPVELTVLNGSPIIFTDIGSTVGLTVEARFNDGSTERTLAGVNFIPSNPNVVATDVVGTLTSVAAGTSLLTVRKDGVVTVVTVVVTTSGDTDGDGINDDIELSFGLDPNDPVDAFEDRDRDGLSNRDEFAAGTLLDNPDTDGDGVKDGEEVIAGDDGFITLPLTPDTDGDGISDGLEVLAGTDPTDSSDFDFGPLIVAIDMVPPVLDVVIDSVEGFREVQFRAVAELIDGSQSDVTRFSNFSPQGACGLTGLIGKINFNAAGVCEISATAGVITGSATVNAAIFTPTALSALNIGYTTYDVAVSADETTAYIADRQGMTIVSIEDRESPAILSVLPLGHPAMDVLAVSGNRVYLAANASGLIVVDVSDRNAPVLLEQIATDGVALDLSVSGSHLYVAIENTSVEIFDISNIDLPVKVATAPISGHVLGVAANEDGRLAVVAKFGEGIDILDISDPLAPAVIGSLSGGQVFDVEVSGDFAFLADRVRSMVTVDISNPAAPVLGPGLIRAEGGLLVDIAIQDNFAFGADIFFVNGVPIVSTEGSPVLAQRGILDFRELGSANGDGIAVTARHVYLVAAARLFIGRYRQCNDPDDDGLCNDDEAIYGTDFSNADTDGDFLSDGYEIETGLNPLDGSDGYLVDSDGDGLSDSEDVINKLDPQVADTDGDQLTDFDEVRVHGTLGDVADTDDDGIDDFVEVSLGLSPLDPADNNIESFVTGLTAVPADIVLGVANSAKRVQVRFMAAVDAGGTPLTVDVSDNTRLSTTYVSSDTSVAISVQRGRFDVLDTGSANLSGSFAGFSATTALLIEGLFDESFNGVTESWSGQRDYASLSIVDSTVTGDSLAIAGDLLVVGGTSQLTLTDLDVGGNLLLDGADLEFDVENVNVAGEIRIVNGATLRGVPLEPLKLTANSVSVDASSAISVAGMGHHAGNGPEGDPDPAFRMGCHGGMPATGSPDCVYGDYRRARYAGRGGSGSAGGGVLEINASSVLVDGLLSAKGSAGNGSLGSGGGAIHIETSTLTGAGDIDVRGGRPAFNFSRYAGGGGRASIYADDVSGFTGNLLVGTAEIQGPGGSGTGYIKLSTEPLGRLLLDNGARQAPLGSTPLPSVGRHVITGADLVGLDQWVITVAGVPWQANGQPWDSSITGVEVDLDAAEDASALYKIIAHEANTLTLNSSNDLSGVLGQELIGVHRFDNLEIRNGASLSVGEDRLLVEDASRFTLDGSSSIRSGDLFFANGLALDNEVMALGTNNPLRVNGDVTLTNNSQITALGGSLDQSLTMRWRVSGILTIEAGSSISVAGLGYYSGNGPEGDPDPAFRMGCHGGAPASGLPDCVYGDYRRARFAGRGGSGSRGGAVLEIHAASVVLNGTLSAKGGAGNGNLGSGGGAIHIETGTLTGAGDIDVRGGKPAFNFSRRAGGGGRTSIYADDVSGFTGNLLVGTAEIQGPGGSGTGYIKLSAEPLGRLLLDNGGRQAPIGSTQLPSIGRHVITGADLVGLDQWVITVTGVPWETNGQPWNSSITGVEVDLDAAEDASALYRVVAHEANTLTIITADDLGGVLGQELIGVHRFDSLEVRNGASLGVGEDRLLVEDASRFIVDDSSSIQSGDLFFANGLVLDNEVMSLGTNVPLRVIGDVSLTNNSRVTAQVGSLDPSLTMRWQVSGNFTIDAGSSISVSGLGYYHASGPASDPDPNSRRACHGGMRATGSADCVFGDYRRARYPGRGGVNNRGGGVLELSAASVNLDGIMAAVGSSGGSLAGSGGAIHLEAGTLTGTGTFDVRGGSASNRPGYASGAGGRLSIYADNVAGFTGDFLMATGNIGSRAGSGTAYIKLNSASTAGLIVDNQGQVSPSGGTPLKQVGRHTITMVDDLGENNWRVEVTGNPWAEPISMIGVGLQGASVILDSTDTAGPAYLVESNDTNALYLSTSDDLSLAVGRELVGITRLETLKVLNKAHLSVGDDIIVVEDLAGSDTSTGFVDAGAGSVLP